MSVKKYPLQNIGMFVGGILVSYKNKKQKVVACTSVKTEYRAMTIGVTKLIYTKSIVKNLEFYLSKPMDVFVTIR